MASIALNQGSKDETTNVKKLKAGAFVELLTHIENLIEEGTFCFKLASLRHLYKKHLADFGINSEINKGHFKSRVMENK